MLELHLKQILVFWAKWSNCVWAHELQSGERKDRRWLDVGFGKSLD